MFLYHRMPTPKTTFKILSFFAGMGFTSRPNMHQCPQAEEHTAVGDKEAIQVLMENFTTSDPGSTWKGSKSACQILWRLLEGLGTLWETGLCRWGVRWANNGETHLHLLLTKREDLVRDVKARVSLSCHDH